jgi:hypothetical protein
MVPVNSDTDTPCPSVHQSREGAASYARLRQAVSSAAPGRLAQLGEHLPYKRLGSDGEDGSSKRDTEYSPVEYSSREPTGLRTVVSCSASHFTFARSLNGNAQGLAHLGVQLPQVLFLARLDSHESPRCSSQAATAAPGAELASPDDDRRGNRADRSASSRASTGLPRAWRVPDGLSRCLSSWSLAGLRVPPSSRAWR